MTSFICTAIIVLLILLKVAIHVTLNGQPRGALFYSWKTGVIGGSIWLLLFWGAGLFS